MSTRMETRPTIDLPRPSLLAAICRRAMFKKLALIDSGALQIREGRGVFNFGAVSASCPLSVSVAIHDPACYVSLALGGSVGAAESFMQGAWSTDDLTGLVQIFVRNRRLLDGLDRGSGRAIQPALRAFHWIRRNTVRGSRVNIAAHYDLGNDFFKLFLDETMMYSAAVFPSESTPLVEASRHKLDLICRKLALKPGDEVLEIGTGWGGFALHAAERYGCRVTTTTISKEQFRMARERVRQAGLEQQVKVIDKDYRHLAGQFDKLVSIEMIEAIGYQYFDTFFSQISRLLKTDGAALIQTIVIADQHYERARRSVDFIKRYIFPGGCLPSVATLMKSVAKKTDLLLVDLQDLSIDYARTLAAWHTRFCNNVGAIRNQGFPEEFLRMWQYYFCYCEGAFRERAIGDVQLLFHKPRNPAYPIPRS